MDVNLNLYKSEYPQFFEKTLCIKLNRIDISPRKNEKPNCKFDSSISRVTRSKKNESETVEWVRISKGDYNGDIATVEKIDYVNNEAHLKLFPRIDYDSIGVIKMQSKLKRRPSLKQFDPDAIR